MRRDLEDFEREISSRAEAAERSGGSRSSRPEDPEVPALHPREVSWEDWSADLKAALHPEEAGWSASWETDRCRVEARRYREGTVEILTSPTMRAHRATTVALSLTRRGWSVTLRPA